MGTKQKVFSIKEKLNNLDKQLEKIQQGCIHKNQSIKFINQIKSARWVCEECQHTIRIPTQEEIVSWLNK